MKYGRTPSRLVMMTGYQIIWAVRAGSEQVFQGYRHGLFWALDRILSINIPRISPGLPMSCMYDTDIHTLKALISNKKP